MSTVIDASSIVHISLEKARSKVKELPYEEEKIESLSEIAIISGEQEDLNEALKILSSEAGLKYLDGKEALSLVKALLKFGQVGEARKLARSIRTDIRQADTLLEIAKATKGKKTHPVEVDDIKASREAIEGLSYKHNKLPRYLKLARISGSLEDIQRAEEIADVREKNFLGTLNEQIKDRVAIAQTAKLIKK